MSSWKLPVSGRRKEKHPKRRQDLEIRTLDGPPAIIRVDHVPGVIGLRDGDTLLKCRILLEISRIKKKKKNPVTI